MGKSAAMQLVDLAIAKFMHLATHEIVGSTGDEWDKFNERCEPMKRKWRPSINKKEHPHDMDPVVKEEAVKTTECLQGGTPPLQSDGMTTASALDDGFLKAAGHQGNKPGKVFETGINGTVYYPDIPSACHKNTVKTHLALMQILSLSIATRARKPQDWLMDTAAWCRMPRYFDLVAVLLYYGGLIIQQRQ